MIATKARKTPAKRAFRPVSAQAAAEAIGHLDADSEIYGITRGDISLTDIIDHAMNETDSRNVVLATWTAAAGSLKAFGDMCTARAFTSVRLIVDPSFVTRKPEDCATVHSIFGSDAIRCVPLHAKFVVLTGGRLPVTVRTSMNLNPNRRLESYEISTSQEMADYHLQLADDIWREFPAPLPGQRHSQPGKRLAVLDGSDAPKSLF